MAHVNRYYDDDAILRGLDNIDPSQYTEDTTEVRVEFQPIVANGAPTAKITVVTEYTVAWEDATAILEEAARRPE